MGCDIHLHAEVKIKGVWHHYSAPTVDRSYALFGLMAGVRGEEEPISPPKGLPADITEVTRLSNEGWGADGHSHSWLSAEELLRLEERWNALVERNKWDRLQSGLEYHYFGYLEGNDWAGFTAYPEEREDWIEDVRFVFWFDN